jgi:hemin uptake protein HemP
MTLLVEMTRATPVEVPQHDALRLTEGGTQAQIVLNGQIYCLRITRAGKLILTK